MAPLLEPLLLSTSVPYLLPVLLLLLFFLAARTSPRRGNHVGYPAAGNTNSSWNCSNEDTNNVGPADARIRGMVEETVEAILPGPAHNDGASDGGLDEASVERHPAYGRVYERHEPALAAALAALQRALLDGVDANTAATKLATLVRALGSDSQVTTTTTCTTTTQTLPPSPTPLHDRTYEDILATAIVNKVIERCQQQKLLVSSPESQTEPQRRSRRRRARERSAKGSSESLSRSPSPCERPSSRSFVSSLEVRLGASGVSGSSGSGCSATSAASGELDYDESDSWSEPLALTVEETLEETTLSTAISDNSDLDEDGPRRRRGPEPADKLDFFLCGINFLNSKNPVPFPELGADIIDVDVDSEESDIDGSVEGGSDDEKEREDEEEEDTPATVVQIAAPVGSWEDNWLFQSRRLKTTTRGHQPVPVPMLVPNPSQDLRPLIGDIDAEETSDLSECSDDAIQDVVLAEGEGMSQWDDDDIAEACNTHLLQQAASDKDSELTVLYAAPDRRPAPAQRTITPFNDRDDDSGQASLESTGVQAEPLKVATDGTAPAPDSTLSPTTDFVPIPAPRPTLPVATRAPVADFPSITSEPVEIPTEREDVEKSSDSDPDMSAPPRPGTIAAREHEKWQHAVPLANNPYSPENIERRLRERGRLIDLPEISNIDRLESSGPSLLADDKENGDSPRIHISVGNQPDPRRYSRDFYVNTDSNGCRDSSSFERVKPPNGMKPRVGRGRGRQDNKVAGDIRTSGDGHRCSEEDSISLPSVKELARNFIADQAGLADKSCPRWRPEDSSSCGRSIPERKVIIVDLESNNHQVHSLTARSMPRAFREGLRHSSPPVTPVRVTATPKSGERPDPEGAGASDTTRR